jgi:hypothetical protein
MIMEKTFIIGPDLKFHFVVLGPGNLSPVTLLSPGKFLGTFNERGGWGQITEPGI